LLAELNHSIQLSFIIVTHDKRLASTMDRVLELKAGQLFPVNLRESRVLDKANNV
jgi:ABC-type lipoprotein export system ATPase subunit